MPEKVQPSTTRLSPRSSVLDQRPEYERLGEWLRAQREAKGMQQKPVSRALSKAETFLNKVEHGHQRIDLIEFLDLWCVLDLPTTMTIGDLIEATAHRPSMISQYRELRTWPSQTS